MIRSYTIPRPVTLGPILYAVALTGAFLRAEWSTIVCDVTSWEVTQ